MNLFRIFLLLFGISSFAQKNNPEILDKEVSTIINQFIDNSKIPGAVVAIKKDNKLVLEKAFGQARD